MKPGSRDMTIFVFTFFKRIARELSIYQLTDDSGEILEVSFYEEELHKVIKEDNIFRIESILNKKKTGRYTFLLVKWKGYPEKFNSWVNEEDIKNLQKGYQINHLQFSPQQKWTKPKHFI